MSRQRLAVGRDHVVGAESQRLLVQAGGLVLSTATSAPSSCAAVASAAMSQTSRRNSWATPATAAGNRPATLAAHHRRSARCGPRCPACRRNRPPAGAWCSTHPREGRRRCPAPASQAAPPIPRPYPSRTRAPARPRARRSRAHTPSTSGWPSVRTHTAFRGIARQEVGRREGWPRQEWLTCTRTVAAGSNNAGGDPRGRHARSVAVTYGTRLRGFAGKRERAFSRC